MYRSTIKWYEGTREVTHATIAEHLAWLTMLADATGQEPETYNADGQLVRIRYTARGNAYLAN